ncbi:MAG: lysostaphin resistance A-like protein [Aggregatilineaceae bacterium]
MSKSMIIALIFYYGMLLGGLATMLVSGWGWVAWGTYLVAMPAGALALRYAGLRSWPALTKRPRHRALRSAMFAAALAAALVLAFFAALTAISWVTVDQHRVSIRALVVSVLGPQLLVATWEELAFRGALQPIAIAHLGTVKGLATVSVLFGLFHLPNIFYHDVPAALIPQTVITLTLMGFVLGLTSLWTDGQLILPIALHFGWNSACFGLEQTLSYHFTGPQWLIGTPAWFPESGLLGALALAALAVPAKRLARLPSRNPVEVSAS